MHIFFWVPRRHSTWNTFNVLILQISFLGVWSLQPAGYLARNLGYTCSSVLTVSSPLVGTVVFGLFLSSLDLCSQFLSPPQYLYCFRSGPHHFLSVFNNMVSKLLSHLSFLYPLQLIHYLLIVSFYFFALLKITSLNYLSYI